MNKNINELKKLADNISKIQDQEKIRHLVKTRLLWYLLHDNNGDEPFTVNEVLRLAKLLFPGFDYIIPMTYVLALEKIIKPAIYMQHPEILECSYVEIAIVNYGEEIGIVTVKRCNGDDWLDWIPVIEPGFSYKKWCEERENNLYGTVNYRTVN